MAVEVALTQPELAESLLLIGPGGSLFAEVTPELQVFFDAERSALARDDVAAAVGANLTAWVDGPRRAATDVDPTVRDLVGQMQRRAFDLTLDWDDVEEDDLHPPALERLAEVRACTLVLVGGLDLDAILDTARLVTDAIPVARRIDWPDVAHLGRWSDPTTSSSC